MSTDFHIGNGLYVNMKTSSIVKLTEYSKWGFIYEEIVALSYGLIESF